MIRMDIQRTDFYNELGDDERKQYFYQSRSNYLPNIDNIYYSVKINGDSNENSRLVELFNSLKGMKQIVREKHESINFFEDLYLDAKAFQIYKYCLTCPDLYDVFILDYLPNLKTPRILVQIRSYGLWVHGWEKLLKQSFECVSRLFFQYGCDLLECRENRIDYCFHTNALTNPEKLFSDRTISNTMITTMEKYHFTGRVKSKNSKSNAVLFKDYYALGERKSNYVFIRFYNKALEVIEKGYKAYFFKIWLDNGITSFYDNFCFEYAYKEKNFNYIHKARLEFYLQYGKDEKVKQEFRIALNEKNKKVSEYKELADAYMPDVTRVLNVEFQTQRKFYYLSDDFIDRLPIINRETNIKRMNRLYRIIDNRGVFLDYLTSTTVKFIKKDGTYVDWWERLRGVSIKERQTDESLLRDYSHDMDMELMKRRLINAIAGNAVYMNKDKESGFIEDLTDILSNINDNDKYNINLSYYDDEGEVSDIFKSELLEDYEYKKEVREKRIQNRKKNANVQHVSDNPFE